MITYLVKGIENYTIGILYLCMYNLDYTSSLLLVNNNINHNKSTQFTRFCIQIHLLNTVFNKTVLITKTLKIT